MHNPWHLRRGVLMQAHNPNHCVTGSTGAACRGERGCGCFHLMARGLSQNICRGQRAQLCFPFLPSIPQSQLPHQWGAHSFRVPSEIKQCSKIHILAIISNCCAYTKISPGISPCPGFPNSTAVKARPSTSTMYFILFVAECHILN